MEYLLMGLRLTDGIDLARFEALSGTPLNKTRIDELVEQDLLCAATADNRLQVTQQGRRVLNSVIGYLV